MPLPGDASSPPSPPPDDTATPLVPPPQSPPARPRGRADESWPALFLVLLTFAAVTGGVLAAWWRVAPRPPTDLERYYPHADGTTLSYRVAGGSGPELFQSSSTELIVGTDAGSQMPARLLTRALSLSAGGAPSDDDQAMLERAQSAEAHLLRLARATETTYQASGAITSTAALYLVLPERVGLIMLDETPIDPPLPILDTAMAVGETLTASGTFDSSLPYTATLTLEAREGADTPAGRLADCLRTRLELELGGATSSLLSWFCDGVGLARQESRALGETEIRTYELIAASTPTTLLRSQITPPLLDAAGAARPRGPDGAGALPELPAGELTPLWSYVQSGTNSDITAAPLAAGDLLIVGGAGGGLTAIDRATHERRWQFQAAGPIIGAPVAEGGALYFGANDRRLYALDLASGAFRWAFAARDIISASPEVAGDTVYVGSEDRTVYALDAGSGEERWRFTAGDAVVTTPRLAGDTLFVGADDGVLYALDARSGEPRWAYSTEGAITASPLVRDGVVYAGSHDGALYALAAASASADGELLWSYDAEASIEAGIALAGDSVYLATIDGSLRAVETASGAERWRAGDGLSFTGAPLVAGERVLIGRERAILAFAASDGRALAPIVLGSAPNSHGLTTSLSGDGAELFAGRAGGIVQVIGVAQGQPWASHPAWKADGLTGHLRGATEAMAAPPALMGDRLAGVTFGGLSYSVSLADGSFRDHGRLGGDGAFMIPPAAEGGLLYAVDNFGTLVAYDMEAGRRAWSAALDGATRGAPALVGGRVLVAASGEAGTMALAFDARSGEQVWRRELAPSPTGAAYTLLHDGRFFVTAGVVEAIDPASGEILWSSDDELIAVQLAAAGDTLYGFVSDGQQWLLAAWDTATGTRRLAAPVAAPTFPNIAGGIAAGDGHVALLLHDATLMLLDAGSGAERWRLKLGGGARGAPVIHGGHVLVQTKHNHLRAYTLADGRLAGDFAILDDVSVSDFSAVSPLVADGRLYVAFYQGVAALNLAEGSR